MLLLEYEGKKVLESVGLTTPQGFVVRSVDEVDAATRQLKMPVMVKAQVLSGGRGKAGGVLTADSGQTAKDHVSAMLGSQLKDLQVAEMLIEEKVEFDQERYIAILIDGNDVVAMIGRQGGVEVESYFDDAEGHFCSFKVNGLLGFSHFQVRKALQELKIAPRLWSAYSSFIERMVAALYRYDATLIEVNPVGEQKNGDLIALDARVSIDPGAVYRHPHFAEIDRTRKSRDRLVDQFQNLEIQYVPLGGSIGLINAGAGAGTAIMDWVEQNGGRMSAFVDLDYTIMSGKTLDGLRFLLDWYKDDQEIKAIIINFTSCGHRLDLIAADLVTALTEDPSRKNKPIYVHIQGNRGDDAQQIIREHGYVPCVSLKDAVEGAVGVAI